MTEGDREQMPEKFYKDNIDSIDLETLLRANPFDANLKINFDHSISKELFFSEMYVDPIPTPSLRRDVGEENGIFDKAIKTAIDGIENKHNHIQLIQIKGYGGCGKSTFIHHLLWKNESRFNFQSDIINYERKSESTNTYLLKKSS